ncbi:MAG: universal stress protein [Woeseia sp.]
MYKKILVAVDLSETSPQVIKRAKQLADKIGAAMQLLHVVEYIPIESMEPMGDALLPSMDIHKDMISKAERELDKLAKQYGLGDIPRLVSSGSIKGEIVRVAEEDGCDLVVLGSRERHGLSILLNATDDTVLHKAKCDMLAVRLS